MEVKAVNPGVRPVVLMVPMRKELDPLMAAFPPCESVAGDLPFQLFAPRESGSSALPYLLLLCGFGKVQSATAAFWAIHALRARALINVGCCGALSPSLRVGDIAVCSYALYHDVYFGEPNLLGQVQGYPLHFPADGGMVERFCQSLPRGPFVTGEYFIPTPEELRRIHSIESEPLVVDMETAAIAQVAYSYSVPFAALRVVSDTPIQPGVNHSAQYENFWHTTAPDALARLRGHLRAVGI